jgi:UDP-GlcNAc:undecaprenyl-phosphate/decaprenyl-phosphate GlcNAc-1-phosphate transferase
MNALLLLLLPSVAAAAIAFALTPLVARLAVVLGAIDMPGDRKIHDRPIPRLGGLAVVSAIAIVGFASRWYFHSRWRVAPELAFGVGLGVLPILAVSIVDDIRSIGAWPKFLAHIIGASIAVAAGVSFGANVHLLGMTIHLGWLAIPLSVLWIVGVTNAFNIIDGLDGLSAGLALIAAISMAAVFALVGQPTMAGAVLVLAGALAGFLPYNVHPARLFLGDTGATAIGFCLAAFALKGGSTLSSGFAALLPVFIMGLPIADTLIAMARRTVVRLEGRHGGVFVADRNHIHHRLLASGIDHGRAVLILYGVGLIFAGAAFISMFLRMREGSLFIVGLLMAGFVGVNKLGFEEFAFIRKGTVLKMYDAPVVKRSMFVVFADVGMAVLAAYLALGLKNDAWSIGAMRAPFLSLAGTAVPLTVLVFWRLGLYRRDWRLAGVNDLMRASSATLAVTMLTLARHIIWSPTDQSFTVFLIYGLASMVLVTGSRASYVLLLISQRRASNRGTPVLLYGAGVGGVAGVRELFAQPETGLRPIGFIDDDRRKCGKLVLGLPVLGSSANLASIIRSHDVRAVLVSSSKIGPERAARAKSICERSGIRMFKLDIRLERLDEPTPLLEPALSSATRPVSVPAPEPAPSRVIDQLDVIGAQPCHSCGSRNVHRSKARSLYERFRKLHTATSLYRCHDCTWRGWLLPIEYAPIIAGDSTGPVTDISALDRAFEETASSLTPRPAHDGTAADATA